MWPIAISPRPRRKFIIADTPGHEQYTRNMATGASTADAAVVLIDASKGVLIQSRRHAYIASLLRVRHVLVAVNKMDLIGYDEADVSARSRRDFSAVLEQIAADTGNPVEAHFVPVSALKGDNVVHRTRRRCRGTTGRRCWSCWRLAVGGRHAEARPFRFPVQRVLRPDHTFRGFAGQIASGTVRTGDAIAVFPSGRKAKIERIVTLDGDLERGHRAAFGDAGARPRSRHQPRRFDCRREASPATVAQQREGGAGVDGSAAAGTESPLSAEAHQPHRACIGFSPSIIARIWARSSTSRRRRCA